MFDLREIQVFSKDADNLVGVYKGVFLQVRNGRMTPEAVSNILSIVRLLAAKFYDRNVAALMIIEDSAEVPDAATRAAQTQAFKTQFRSPRVFVAYCVMGDGPKAMLLRAFGRLLATGQSRFGVFDDPAPAAKWLEERLNRAPTSSDLEAAVAWARREARMGGVPEAPFGGSLAMPRR